MSLGSRFLLAKVLHSPKPMPPSQLHSKEITKEASTGQNEVFDWASWIVSDQVTKADSGPIKEATMLNPRAI